MVPADGVSNPHEVIDDLWYEFLEDVDVPNNDSEFIDWLEDVCNWTRVPDVDYHVIEV